jgi:hypothetical protein
VRRYNSIKTMALGLALISGLWLCPWGVAQPDAPVYPEIKTAGGLSRVFQQLTGFTPFSGWVANRILRRELGRHLQGHLHSHLRLFSGTDLLAGKARGISISGKNLLLEGYIPLSQFTFNSQPDLPIFISRTRRPILLRPVTFQAAMTLTEHDLNRMLTSDRGRQMLTNMKVKLPPFGKQSFDAMNPVLRLEGDRVHITTLMNLHGAPVDNALPMQISGKIVPDKASLNLSDLDLKIEGIQDTEGMAQVVEHYFNELVDLNHIKVEGHKLKVQITQAETNNGRLNLAATVIVTPDPKALKAALAEK